MLGLVYDQQKIGMSQLTELLRSKASHPTVIVETLRKRGLLARTEDPDDKRAKLVTITPAGQDMVKMAEPQVRAAIRKALADVDRNDLQGYFMALVGLSRLD